MRLFTPLTDRFSRPCFLESESGEKLASMRAFISPLRYKNKMYLYGVNTEIGYNPEGYYLYIGPPEPDLEKAEKSYVSTGGDRYKIDRAEKVYAGEKAVYIWAIIRKTVESEEE